MEGVFHPLLFALTAATIAVTPAASQDKLCSGSFPPVVTPAVVVPGRDTFVLVTSPATVNVSVQLLSRPEVNGGILLAQVNQVISGGSGVVRFPVPPSLRGQSGALQVTAAGQDGVPLAQRGVVVAGALRDVIIQTSQRRYSPGEQVVIWLLGLDWQMRPAPLEGATVYVEDPRGVKPVLWDDLNLPPAVSNVSLRLSSVAPEGRWKIVVVSDGGRYGSEFNVTADDDERDVSVQPEVVMAEAHFVQLRFGANMRTTFKLGLPFLGKVEAASSEKVMRVRVRVLDNGTAIFSQDVEVRGWEAPFAVPAILSDSDTVTLQAELISVNGRETDLHYVLASETLRKWRPPTHCNLVVQGVESTFRPNDIANVSVLSTCGCSQRWFFVVTTSGAMTSAALLNHVTDDSQSADTPRSVCRVDYSFTVKPEMAPASHMLVYFVGEDGETVSDDVTFDVVLAAPPLLEVPSEEAIPGEELWVQPLPLPDWESGKESVCVVSGGRDSEEGGQEPPGRLLPASSSSSSSMTEPGLSTRFDDTQTSTRLVGPDSAKADLTRASLLACDEDYPSSASKARQGIGGLRIAGLHRVLSWTCEEASSRALSSAMAARAPSEGGEWNVWGLLLSPEEGLRLAPPLLMDAKAPLQLRFRMPNSVQVGEVAEIEITISSHHHSCLDVTTLLTASAGFRFRSNGLLFLSEQLRLGPSGATVLVVHVEAVRTGAANLTAQVSGFAGDGCDSEVNEQKGEGAAPTRPVGVATLAGDTQILAEGVTKTRMQAAYFCANEYVLVSETEDSSLRWAPSPLRRTHLVVWIRASNEARIGLGEESGQARFTFVIGAEDNSRSWLKRSGSGARLATWESPSVLSGDEFRPFWIIWDEDTLALGQGNKPGDISAAVISWKSANPDKDLRKIRHVGFAAPFGTPAQFRLWREDEESGFSHVFHLDFPPFPVPGTEGGSLLVSGGFSLPCSDPGSMDEPPSPTFSASLNRLLSLLPWNPTANPLKGDMDATSRLQPKIQEILAFRRKDGAFGDHHDLPSIRYTSRALEALFRAQSLFSVDPELIRSSRNWLWSQQKPDGGIYNESDDKQTSVSTTAEVLVALLETSDDAKPVEEDDVEEEERMQKARFYLEKHLPLSGEWTDPLPLSASTSALVRTRSPLRDTCLALVDKRTRRVGGTGDSFSWDGVMDGFADESPQAESGVMAGVWLLEVHSINRQLREAEAVARWIALRAPMLMHLAKTHPVVWRATSQFSRLSIDLPRALTLSLATSGMEMTDTLVLNNPDPTATNNPDNPESNNNNNNNNAESNRLRLPSLPTRLFAYATGAGCATLQSEVTYSTYATSGQGQATFDLLAEVESEAPPDVASGQPQTIVVRVCIRAKAKDKEGPTWVEARLFSGFHLETLSSEGGMPGEPAVMRTESRGERVWLLLKQVPSECHLCLRLFLRRTCAVGSLRPALVRAFQPGKEAFGTEKFFHGKHGGALVKDALPDDWGLWTQHNQSDSEDVTTCVCADDCISTSTVRPEETTTTEAATTTITTPAATTTTESTTSVSSTELPTTTVTQKIATSSATTTVPTRNLTRPKVITPIERSSRRERVNFSEEENNNNNNKDKDLYLLDGQTLWMLLRDAASLQMRRVQIPN